MRYLIAALLLAGCTSSARVNGALWLGLPAFTGPIGAAIVGFAGAPEISNATNQVVVNQRERVTAQSGVCKAQ